MNKRTRSRGLVSTITAAVFFVAVLIMLLIGTSGLSGSAGAEGLAACQQAIERATVLCYAVEGFYPPGISYLEEKYAVQIDHSRYTVLYEAVAANVMPVIRVVGR